MNSGLIPGLIAGPNRLSKAVLSRKQSIPDAEVVQALKNLDINATPGIITTLPSTTSTLAALETAQTFTSDNVFSSTTASTTTSSGAVKIGGGLGVIGAGFFGSLNCTGGTITAKQAVIGVSGLTNAGSMAVTGVATFTNIPVCTNGITLGGSSTAVNLAITGATTLTLDTDATSSTAGGTLTVTGGAAVSKKLFVGTLLDLVATTATAGQITQAGTRLLHTYGSNNLFVGSSAGKTSGTIGSGNVGLGRDALTSITSGTNNTCLGDQSGYFISSGSSNMLIGNTAGVGITTGSQNIAMGVAALRFITSNGDCTAIGHQALYSATGQKNTGIGSNASWTCTSGSKNTFVGEYAGASTDSIGGLTGIGITTGSNNTMLGQNTASTTAAGTYRTAIGSDSRCNVNNSIKLGRDHTSTVPGDMVSLPSVLTANLPVATAAMAGAIIYVSDDGTGHINFCNGSSWARIN
jgi:hypothetical protein